jgi:hypothetical protein
MHQEILYHLHVGSFLSNAPYRGQCFGLSFVPGEPREGHATSAGIHTILSVEPG